MRRFNLAQANTNWFCIGTMPGMKPLSCLRQNSFQEKELSYGCACAWGGWVHIVAARLGCKSSMVGTGWGNSCPGCMDRLRESYSNLVGGSFLAVKATWAMSRCSTTKSADYCMLVNEWVWLRSIMLLLVKAGSGHKFSFGGRSWTEIEIQCAIGMYRLKLVSSEKFRGFLWVNLIKEWRATKMHMDAQLF